MIIIIGGTSFVGVNTAESFLKAGYKVIATGRNHVVGNILEKFGAEFIELDITDEKNFEKLPPENVEGVIMLAALLPANSKADLKIHENAADYFRVNTIGTINVLEYCRKK